MPWHVLQLLFTLLSYKDRLFPSVSFTLNYASWLPISVFVLLLFSCTASKWHEMWLEWQVPSRLHKWMWIQGANRHLSIITRTSWPQVQSYVNCSKNALTAFIWFYKYHLTASKSSRTYNVKYHPCSFLFYQQTNANKCKKRDWYSFFSPFRSYIYTLYISLDLHFLECLTCLQWPVRQNA